MKKLLVILLLVVIGFAPCVKAADADSTTLLDMRTTIRNLLGGPSVSGYWSDDMINDFVDMACREYSSIANVGVRAETTIYTVQGTTDYILPSNFVERIGVLRYSAGRLITLNGRGIDPSSPAEMPFGQDNASSTGDHPKYYTIGHSDSGYFLRLDPVQIPDTSVTDTILIDYKRYAAALDTDTAVTDIPYQGRNFVIRMAFLNCLIAGRDQPGVSMTMPQAQVDYKDAREAAMNRYAPKYDPNWKPAQ
jgi:hypothetical protein